MIYNSQEYLQIKSKIKYFLFLCIYFLLYPLCKIIYCRKNNWLICERGTDAQDNGFVFFEYLVKEHPEINCVYLIKRESAEFNKVQRIGKVVEFGSLRHFLMTIGFPVKISSHLYGYAPWRAMALYFRRNKTHDSHIFLQHGITKNDHKGLYGDACKSLSLFICGAKPEYDAIYSSFHYKNNVPQYTGFARYDLLMNSHKKNQILIMPTWRAELSKSSESDFLLSDYYNSWNGLLNNNEFIDLCTTNGISVKFYLHFSMQKFSSLFKSEHIKVVKFGEETVQNLLKESALLITDFSSVYFDFGYMLKPVVHYQFDEDTFYDKHYEKGYFDYRRDGFGDVCTNSSSLIDSIKKTIQSNFVIEEKYKMRIERFFLYRDNKNCERIYNCIRNLRTK